MARIPSRHLVVRAFQELGQPNLIQKRLYVVRLGRIGIAGNQTHSQGVATMRLEPAERFDRFGDVREERAVHDERLLNLT